MILQYMKETKRYRRMDAQTDGQREHSIPSTNKVDGGYKSWCQISITQTHLPVKYTKPTSTKKPISIALTSYKNELPRSTYLCRGRTSMENEFNLI